LCNGWGTQGGGRTTERIEETKEGKGREKSVTSTSGWQNSRRRKNDRKKLRNKIRQQMREFKREGEQQK
jgi:hypothetical protein